jgi:hypothetical protein
MSVTTRSEFMSIMSPKYIHTTRMQNGVYVSENLGLSNGDPVLVLEAFGMVCDLDSGLEMSEFRLRPPTAVELLEASCDGG